MIVARVNLKVQQPGRQDVLFVSFCHDKRMSCSSKQVLKQSRPRFDCHCLTSNLFCAGRVCNDFVQFSFAPSEFFGTPVWILVGGSEKERKKGASFFLFHNP